LSADRIGAPELEESGMSGSALVIAANGRVARRVVAGPADAGSAPTALVRNGLKADELLRDRYGDPTYAKLVVGELSDAKLLDSLLTETEVATDKPATGYDKRTMAADVIALADHLCHRRIALAGHDRGARVATRFAKDHRDRLDRLPGALDLGQGLRRRDARRHGADLARYGH
jgi:hypothetical protein